MVLKKCSIMTNSDVIYSLCKRKKSCNLLCWYFVCHMCTGNGTGVSDVRKAFVLGTLTYLCICVCVCVCLSNGASRGHVGYNYIYHLPHSLHFCLSFYTSIIFHLFPSFLAAFCSQTNTFPFLLPAYLSLLQLSLLNK